MFKSQWLLYTTCFRLHFCRTIFWPLHSVAPLQHHQHVLIVDCWIWHCTWGTHRNDHIIDIAVNTTRGSIIISCSTITDPEWQSPTRWPHKTTHQLQWYTPCQQYSQWPSTWEAFGLELFSHTRCHRREHETSQSLWSLGTFPLQQGCYDRPDLCVQHLNLPGIPVSKYKVMNTGQAFNRCS